MDIISVISSKNQRNHQTFATELRRESIWAAQRDAPVVSGGFTKYIAYLDGSRSMNPSYLTYLTHPHFWTCPMSNFCNFLGWYPIVSEACISAQFFGVRRVTAGKFTTDISERVSSEHLQNSSPKFEPMNDRPFDGWASLSQFQFLFAWDRWVKPLSVGRITMQQRSMAWRQKIGGLRVWCWGCVFNMGNLRNSKGEFFLFGKLFSFLKWLYERPPKNANWR